MGKWRNSTWGQEITLEYGKAIRGYSGTIGKYRVFGSNGPIGWTSEPLASGPGVILGRKGAYRGVRFSREPFFVIDTAYYVVPKAALDMRWLYYAIIYHKLGEIDDGSPIPSTTRAAVYVRELEVPPLEEQHAIASILSALDDKIELNRRMSETLETTARAIFKDWFVDFGPTRAKMEGQAPYLASELWSLFPEKLDDEGKPEGWMDGKLGDIAIQAGEGVRPGELTPETPYIGLEHMPRKSIALGEWEGAGKVTSGKLAFRRGDLLFGKLRPYFHKVGIAPCDGICSTDIVVLTAKTPETKAFVLACISGDDFVAYTDRTSGGTKMPRTSWGTMAQYKLWLPSDDLFAAFNRLIAPILERVIFNIHEAHASRSMRDLLLPKLMSGEIRVKDAERSVGEVA